jgi:serine phosphatase RsbU (regulator of sigma subunit)
MRKTFGARTLLLVSAPAWVIPASLAAQSIVTITPSQCVWRAGDDPSWAAANLDESGWRTYTQWTQPDQPHYWVRCHAVLGELGNTAHPAIQVTLYAAYQLYLNGAQIGEAGDLRSGNYSMNSIRSFPAPASNLLLQPATVALRITYRYADPWVAATDRSLSVMENGDAVTIEAGDSVLLEGRRADEILSQISDPFINFVCVVAIGVLGLVLLAQFFQDRSRHDLLLLSLTALAYGSINTRLFCVAALWDFPVWASAGSYASAVTVIALTQPLFFFAAAGRRMPLFFWILVALSPLRNVLQDLALFLSPAHSLALEASVTANTWARSLSYSAAAVAALAPFAAFWPYRNITRRLMPLAALSMAWGATMAHYFATDVLLINSGTLAFSPRAQVVVIAWHLAASRVDAAGTAGVLIALMGLLSRDQRRTAEERAALAGEMRAARVVQQVLIPDAIPSAPGFAIESVYKPAGEVGGDFFQIIPADSGGVLIVIGDVSGKGMPAALTVSLLVGTVRTLAHYTQSPGEILSAMNTRMMGRSQGGFTTCLILHARPDGTVTLANAGHLAPYFNGKDLDLENGLPLGLSAESTYAETAITLPANARLTLLTDGVVEARNAQGELFGFERTAAISMKSADQIAHAAEQFGQEDDITVLTLQRMVPA